MKLQDFTEFEPFNRLREKVGTTELGFFELFDPEQHLTGDERSALEQVGQMRKISELKVLPDKTLAIKNSRILAYNPDESWYLSHRKYPCYHIALCAVLDAAIKSNPDAEYLLTTQQSEEYKLIRIGHNGDAVMNNHDFVVCRHCLHTLRYKDYDEYRNRKRGYSQRVLKEFRLPEFYRHYKQYPLGFTASRQSRQDHT